MKPPQATRTHLFLLRSITLAVGCLAALPAPGADEAPDATAPEPPRILAPPAGLTAAPGSRITLSVVAAGGAPLAYAWTRNAQPLPPTATNASLTLEPLSFEDAGAYVVTVRNAAGTVTSPPALVTVVQPPRFLRQPGNHIVTEGSRVTLPSRITGGEPLHLQWLKDGVPIPGATSPTLTFPAVHTPDAGEYRLIARNALGTELGLPAELTVLDGSRIDTGIEGNEPSGAPSGTSSGSSPRILEVRPLTSGAGWQITWSSITGRRYTLQRRNGDDLGGTTEPRWLDLTTVTATTTASSASDRDLQTRAFYRIRLLDADPPAPAGPTLADLRATPSPTSAEGWVALTVHTPDPSGVTRVRFLDGPTLLGEATRLEGGVWRLFWPVTTADNGSHALVATAGNLAGGTTTSPVLNHTVSIASPLVRHFVGRVTLAAAAFATQGTTLTPTGPVQLGDVTLTPAGNRTLTLVAGILTGQGRIELPGLGVVHDGRFSLDAATGWLTALTASAGSLASGSPPPLAPIQLSSRARLVPAELQVNVLAQALQGSGVATLDIPGHPASPARFEGRFLLDPPAHTLTVEGRATLGTLLGNPLVATLRLADSTFTLHGNPILPASPGGPPLPLVDATLSLTFDTQGAPRVTVQGTRSDTGQAFIGSLRNDGSLASETPPPTPDFVSRHPDLFVPLGPGGLPWEGIAVQARADGSLPPLEYRPAGRSLLGAGASFRLRLPDGARFIPGNPSRLEFVRVSAAFGPESPLQFAAPLERSGGNTTSIPIGPLDVLALARLFDSPADLPVTVFGSLKLLWRAGTIEDGGIRGALLVPPPDGMPLPRPSDGDASLGGFNLDLTGRDGFEVRIPLHGELALTDAQGSPLNIGIARGNPAWIVVRPDGSFAFRGRGHAQFPNGVSFDVDLTVADPVYRVGIAAGGSHSSLLDGLGAALPSPDCPLPAPQPLPSSDTLAAAIACRVRIEHAYHAFSAVMTDAGSGSGFGSATPGPSETSMPHPTPLDAWAWVTLASDAQPQPTAVAQLPGLLDQSRRSAVAARDLHGSLRHRLSFERALNAARARQVGGTDPASVATLANDITAAAVQLARDPDTTADPATLRETLALLLETESLLQRIGQDPAGQTPIQHPDLQGAIRDLIASHSKSICEGFGVPDGIFRAAPDSRIDTLSWPALDQALQDIGGLLADAQRLGLDDALDSRLPDEFARQLGDALERQAANALNQAETARDTLGFSAAMEGYLHLAALEPILASDSDLVGRISAVLANLPDRLAALAQSDPTLAPPASLDTLLTRISRIDALRRSLPVSPVVLIPQVQDLLGAMDVAIADALVRLPEIRLSPDALDQLATLLVAGTRNAELRERFTLPPSGATWEEGSLPLFAAALAEVAASRKAWSELHDATVLMLGRATALKEVAPLRARACLVEADRFLGQAHAVAAALGTERQQQQQQQGLGSSSTADLLLPGGLAVHQVAGEIAYNRVTRELAGAFSGELTLPQFAGRLSIANASLSTGGSFDLSTWGNLQLPSAQEPTVEIGVLPAHPLHVYDHGNGRVGLAGSCRLAVNGLFLEAFLSLEDPFYAFGIAAGGLRFDLAESLQVHVPTLAAGSAFTVEVSSALNDYFLSLGSTLEGLRSPSDLPPLPPPGSPPDFRPQPLLSPLDAVAAWADSRLSAAHTNLVSHPDFAATLTNVLRQLKSSSRQLRDHRGPISLEELQIRISILSKIAMARKAEAHLGSAVVEAVTTSEELAAFLQETEDAIVRGLDAADPARADDNETFLDAVGDFVAWAGYYDVFTVPRLARVLGAIQGYSTRRVADALVQLGFDPDTGQVRDAARLAALSHSGAIAAMERLLALKVVLQRNHGDDNPPPGEAALTPAIGTLALQRRTLAMARLRELRRMLLEEPLAFDRNVRHYAEARELRDELIRLIELQDLGTFTYPAGPIDQFTGTAPYQRGLEFANAMRVWSKAVHFITVERPDLQVRRLLPNPGGAAIPLTVQLYHLMGDSLLNGDPMLPLFRSDSVMALPGLARKWRNPPDPVSAYAANRLSGTVRELIADWNDAFPMASVLPEALITHLNDLLVDPLLWDPERFAGVTLRPATADLAARQPTGADLLRLNRMLLEDAYPQHLINWWWPSPDTGDDSVSTERLQAVRTSAALERLTAAEVRVLQTGTSGNLQTPIKLVEELILLARWAQVHQPSELPRLQQSLATLTSRFIVSAETQQAWWETTEYTRRLLQGASQLAAADARNLRDALLQQAGLSLQLSARLTGALTRLTTGMRPVELTLPGDLVIDRVFGEISIERREPTPLVTGTFGGILRFPNSDFHVAVDHATISTDGSFGFAGELGAPIPVGGLRALGRVEVSGQARLEAGQLKGSLTQFTGSGSVFLPPLEGTGEIELAASMSYAADHTLTLATLADDLHLLFSRHFQLFDVGGQLTFDDPLTGSGPLPLPGSGELTLHGGAGFFARTENPRSPDDFLLAGEQLTMRFRSRHDAATGRDFLDLTLLEGTLVLPDIFTAGLCSADASGGSTPVSGRARVQIDPEHPPGLTLMLRPPASDRPPEVESIAFQETSLILRSVGVNAPGIPDLGAEICEGALRIPGVTFTAGNAPLPSLPEVRIDRGLMLLPLPPGNPTTLALSEFQWSLDGLPSGTLELADTLTLADLGGFRFEALGRSSDTEPGCRIRVLEAQGNQPPPFELSGRIRFVVSPDILQHEPTPDDPRTEVAIALEGTARFTPGQAPDLSGLFEGVSLQGSFRLGGGLGLQGFPAGQGSPAEPASITLKNLRNLPAVLQGQPLPDDQAFAILLTGLIQVPAGPAFGGRNLRFLFHNRPDGRPANAPRGVPEFRPGSFEYRADTWELAQQLPFQVSSATLAQIDPNASHPWPQILHPQHWQLTITAALSLPSPEEPVVSGQVYDWTVRFRTNGVPTMDLRALQVGIQNLSFPPIENIGGTLHIGGLEDPPNLFFVGRVGGFVYGYGVDLLLGLGRAGPIGACVRGTLGNVGIPLGTTGFILNGASGGISFANSSADPCLISSYLTEDGSLKSSNELPTPSLPTPPMTWQQVAAFTHRFQERQAVFTTPAPTPAAAATPGAPLASLAGPSDTTAWLVPTSTEPQASTPSHAVLRLASRSTATTATTATTASTPPGPPAPAPR